MKKYLMLVSLFVIGSAAHAGGLSTRHQSSLQHTVDAQSATYSRMGNSYAISGTNVTTSHTVGTGNDAVTTTGGLGVNSYNATTGVGTVGTITAGQGTTNGTGSFSFAQSWTQGDIAGADSQYTDFGTVSVTNAGTQNDSTNAPGTITAAHAITLTGTGNVGTSTTGQFVSEVTIFD